MSLELLCSTEMVKTHFITNAILDILYKVAIDIQRNGYADMCIINKTVQQIFLFTV